MKALGGDRRAFTLIELLVVITIMGILMTILVPAALAVRERARQLTCANQVGQMGKAIKLYESRFQIYPQNWGWPGTGVNTIGHSWIALCLNDLDQELIYKLIKFGEKLSYKASASSGKEPTKDNKTAANAQIQVLKCPSDTGRYTSSNQMFLPGEEVAITSYKACLGSSYPGVTTTRGRNRTVPSGRDPRDYCNGAICRGYCVDKNKPIDFCITSANLTDGAATTFLIGETVIGASAFCGWYWWDGATATCGVDLDQFIENTATEAKDWKKAYGFMSRHRGGANFCMCGGEVKFITTTMDQQTYRNLATIDGREPIDNPDF